MNKVHPMVVGRGRLSKHRSNPLFAYLSVLFAIVISIGSQSCNEPAQSATQSPAASPPTFPVITLSNQEIQGKDQYPAAIEGIENIEIRAKVDGYIQEIYVDEGQEVRKGQVLFKIETQALNQSAEAAESSIAVSESEVRLAEVEVEKLKPLVNKGIISVVQLEVAEANLAAAKSRLAQSKSSHQGILENIGYTQLRSPVNGVVGALPLRKGSLVGRSEVEPLTTVSNISSVYAYFAMNEKDFLAFMDQAEGASISDKLADFPEVELILANGKVYEHTGKIETITGQIDPRTGTITFRATFPNPDKKLRSGASGQISIPKIYDQVILVPEQSTYESQGRKFVYVLTQGNQLKSVPIEYTDIVNGLVVVASGLSAGDQILADGLGKVRNDMVIKPEAVDFSEFSKPITAIFK